MFSLIKETRVKLLPQVRIELTTFRLWDWRATDCAIEASQSDACAEFLILLLFQMMNNLVAILVAFVLGGHRAIYMT